MENEVGGERRQSSGYWRDVAWQLSGSSLAQIVGIAGLPVLARLYTPEDFAVQSLFLQVVTCGTALVTWRYEYFVQLPKSNEDVRAINRLVLILGCVAVAACTPIFWIFRHELAAPLGNAGLAEWLVIAPLTAVLFSWAVAAQNNAQRMGDFRTSGLSELAGKMSYVLTGVVGAAIHSGPFGLVITTAAAALGKLGFVLSRGFALKREPLRADTGSVKRVRGRYGSLATSTVVSHTLMSLAFALPQVAMARLYGSEALGQFALVLATIFLPSSLMGTAMGQVYYQRAAKSWAEGFTFSPLWREMARKLLMIGLPLFAVVALVSPIAYPFVFGYQWHQAGEFATWMSIAAFASFVSSPMDRSCLVVGAASYLLLWSIYRLVSTAGVIWLAAILEFSPTGFVIAYAAQICVVYGIDLFMSRRFARGQAGIFRAR